MLENDMYVIRIKKSDLVNTNVKRKRQNPT